MDELAPGLWRWTSIHPDAEESPQPGSPADWPPEVGSVAYVADDTLVLIDPLVPDEVWPLLDELARDRRVLVLTTIAWHRRSRDEVVARYDASTSRARNNLPSQVVPIPLRGAGETMFWLPDVRTLVPGDRSARKRRRRHPRLPGLVAPLPQELDRRDAVARPAGTAPRPPGRARPHLPRRAGALPRTRGSPRRARVKVSELAPGLWRWTALHPDWKAGEGWEQEVGCVYYEAADTTVLIDPLVPAEQERFFAALDRDVERRGLPVMILLTCAWHARSAAELTERYGRSATRRLNGIEPFVVAGDRGDAVVAAGARDPRRRRRPTRRARMASASARTPGSKAARHRRRFAPRCCPLLDLPIERVLVSHGEPVLEHGRAALERALKA